VAAQHISAGTVVRADMLTAKGPGDGIPANHAARLVGRVAATDVLADTLLPTDALDWELLDLDKAVRDGVGSSA
jgi:sialic acid synthase SpsE